MGGQCSSEETDATPLPVCVSEKLRYQHEQTAKVTSLSLPVNCFSVTVIDDSWRLQWLHQRKSDEVENVGYTFFKLRERPENPSCLLPGEELSRDTVARSMT